MPGSAPRARCLRSRYVVPSVPAPSTSRSALTVPVSGALARACRTPASALPGLARRSGRAYPPPSRVARTRAPRQRCGSRRRALGRRQVVEVERVLAAVVAADVALAASRHVCACGRAGWGALLSGSARRAAGRRPGCRERHRQVGQEPVQPSVSRPLLEGARLRDVAAYGSCVEREASAASSIFSTRS